MLLPESLDFSFLWKFELENQNEVVNGTKSVIDSETAIFFELTRAYCICCGEAVHARTCRKYPVWTEDAVLPTARGWFSRTKFDEAPVVWFFVLRLFGLTFH